MVSLHESFFSTQHAPGTSQLCFAEGAFAMGVASSVLANLLSDDFTSASQVESIFDRQQMLDDRSITRFQQNHFHTCC